MVLTPESVRPVENPVVMPVQVLIPAPDAVGPGNNVKVDRMPAVPVKGLPAPLAPSKTLPVPQAPTAPSKTVPAAKYIPTAPASISPSALGARHSTLIPPDRSFKVLPKRPILFATNRTHRSATGTPSDRFGDAVDAQIRYGSCLVNIPVDKHIEGKLELPGWFSGRDPNKFFLIDATNELGIAAFRAMIGQGGGDTQRDVSGLHPRVQHAIRLRRDASGPGRPRHPVQRRTTGIQLALAWIGLPVQGRRDQRHEQRRGPYRHIQDPGRHPGRSARGPVARSI